MKHEDIRLLMMKHHIACKVCVGHGDVGRGRYCKHCGGTGFKPAIKLCGEQSEIAGLAKEVIQLRDAIALRDAADAKAAAFSAAALTQKPENQQ